MTIKLITELLLIVLIIAALAALIKYLASGSPSLQLRRDNLTLKHLEQLLEGSQAEISSLRAENALLREQLSEMQEAMAEMKAHIIVLLNAVQKLSAEEISAMAVENVKQTVDGLLKKVRVPKNAAKNDGA